MSRLLAALTFSFTCLLPYVAQAAPGDLDATFGGGKGWVNSGFERVPTSSFYCTEVISQADGKLVAAGYGNDDFALVRYNSDGSLDATFSGDGKVTTAIGSLRDEAYSVIQQADGKLVVAGYSFNGNSNDFALVRYNGDGSLDTTFDGDGKVTTAIDWWSEAYSVIQQADGKLVAAGYSSGSNRDFALVRYNSDGSLDTTFGGDGKVTTDIGAQGDSASSVIQQADGKLLAAGYSSNGSDADFVLVRYNSDGSLDTTFGGDGKVTTTIGASEDYANSVIQQADGKLVAAGSSHNGSNYDFALVRYNSDGSLDTTFDGDGRVTTAITSMDFASSVIQQADGKLVAAGSSNNNFALVRYTSDGSLDTTFDSDGKVTTAIGASGGHASSVIQQADGKLVAAGSSHDFSYQEFTLVRYNSDGLLDTTFDVDGKFTMAIGTDSNDSAYSVIQQADGKLVAAGGSNSYNSREFALARYNSDGSLDASFDGDGKVTTDIGSLDDQAWSVIQQADGKLVVAGSSNNGNVAVGAGNNSNDDFALVRYNSDGSLDTTFDGDGKVTTAIVPSGDQDWSNDQARSVIQQADGKLVAAGSSYHGNNDFALVRYNSDGSLDTTFDGDGKVITAIGSLSDDAYSVIQQADGKLVAAGTSQNGNNYDFALVRYNSDGSLDTTFDGDGKVTTDIHPDWSDDQAWSVIQQADGKLVAAGYDSNYDFALVRYNSDGSLDATFDGDGKVTTDIGAQGDYAYSVIQQADGKLVAAGYNSYGSHTDFALVRYSSDGSLDTTFDGDGKVTTDIGAQGDYAYSVIQQADGKLVLAGFSDGMPTGREFVVARFESGQLDTDSDGYVDGWDNCKNTANPEQLNIDRDAYGDACDAFPLDASELVDTDGDGMGNNADTDDDNDSTPDVSDAFPLDAGESVDTDSDGIGNNADTDDDGDGVVDASDNCPLIANADQLDGNSDGQGDACDSTPKGDNDNDGIDNLSDNCPTVSNADQLDADADGQGDACDIFPNDPNLLLQQDGTAKGENLGSSVALADMNNDGVVNLLVGSPLANVTRNGDVLKKAGMIQMISGKDNSVLRTISGSAPNQQLGAAIAVVSDQNKDGVRDIVVGDPLADVTKLMYNSFPVLKDAGRVLLYSGSDGRMLLILGEGKNAGDRFGAAVAAADVNGDGKPDLVVGAPRTDVAGKDAGQVTVFNGFSNQMLYQRNGEQTGENFGAAVAVDSGHLFVGSPQFDTAAIKDAGRVSVFNSGEGSSTALLTVDGFAKGDSFGSAVTAANDSWAVGIPLADSAGKDAGSVQLFTGLNANPVKVLAGATAGDNYGSALNMQGDVNKDDKNDIAIGAAKTDISKAADSKTVLLKDAGRVQVFSGETL